MASTTVALVPLRSPGVGKSRLAPALRPEQRAALAGAMLADVTEALRGSRVDDVLVVAAGPAAAAAAAALGVGVLTDPPAAAAAGMASLDTALAAAIAGLRHGTDVLVVAADLPRLQPAEVDLLLDQDAEVVVAPTGDGGTAALLRRPGQVMGTCYGRDSARRHAGLADRYGLRCRVVDLPGCRLDVDTWSDLVALHEEPLGWHTAAALPALLGRRPAVTA